MYHCTWILQYCIYSSVSLYMDTPVLYIQQCIIVHGYSSTVYTAVYHCTWYCIYSSVSLYMDTPVLYTQQCIIVHGYSSTVYTAVYTQQCIIVHGYSSTVYTAVYHCTWILQYCIYSRVIYIPLLFSQIVQ